VVTLNPKILVSIEAGGREGEGEMERERAVWRVIDIDYIHYE